MSQGVTPASGRWARRFDVALVVLLLLPPVTVFPFTGITLLTTVLSALQIVPLVARRTAPVATFAAVSTLMVLQMFLTDVPVWGQVAMPIAVHAMAVYAPRREAMVALGIALAGSLLGPLDWGAFEAGAVNAVMLVLVTALLVIAPWSLGMWSRTRKAYVAELIERGHRLEREAAQQAELAASDERARIAREMHDVVAHGLSVMIVQADGARYAVRHDPEAAAQALENIAASGREALAEMRRMLGLLRSDDSGSGTRPQPGLADLGYLVEQSRASGMDLAASLPDPLPASSPSVGLTVYRVVQEALTNVRKHAGPDVHVRMHVAVEPGGIVVDVADDGRGAASGHEGTGHGLIGMRERVAVHGGELTAGPRAGGGFALHAVVPHDGPDDRRGM